MNEAVFFANCASYDSALVCQQVETLFTHLDADQLLFSGKKILLKPNLLSKSAPEKAITTHPEVVRAVIRSCKARGASDIVIADSAGGLYNPSQCKHLYQGCGMTAIAQEEGASLYTDCQWEDLPCQGKRATSFQIIKPALEAQIIINLPKAKTHAMTGMTACVKNMFGCIPGLDKSQWHKKFPGREDFGHMLVDLYQALPPTFSILDGILAMEGDGPGGGTPRHLDFLLASKSSLQADLALATMMGYDPMDIPYLQAGQGRGLCDSRFDPGQALGDSEIFAPIPSWILPKTYQESKLAEATFSQFLPKILRPVAQRLEQRWASRPVVAEEKCIDCKKCAEICSKDAIVFPDHKAFIQKKKCISCFCCHEVCPVKAIDIR